jgi:LacI family transcriptional regulator
LATAGISHNPNICLAGEFNRATAYESTLSLMRLNPEMRPTAIFAANDLSAHGAIEAVMDCGFSVPEDIAVVGYDDTWYATVTRPTLSSVNMDVPAIGNCATELLIQSLEGGHIHQPHASLSVSLTIRESCGALLRTRQTQLRGETQ